jgi:sulfotransferase family protein
MLRAAAMVRLARSMAPRLADIHPVSALRPEEDVFLFRDTGMLAVPVTAPGYLAWLQATDPTPAYRTYRGHLQALLAEVPEAVVVWTHGDPPVALASWCSRAAVLASAASDQVDLGALGRRWLNFWATELDRALAARTRADPARFHDVGYEALVADPLGEVERPYARLGLELSAPPGSACAGGSAAITAAAAVAPIGTP